MTKIIPLYKPSDRVALAVTSRKFLINEIKKKKKPGFPALIIERKDCGCKFVYKRACQIPHNNVTCRHGNKIIVYTDLD